MIDKAGPAGLLSPDQVETLVEAHRLYTDATQFMRLAIAGPFDPATAAAGVKRRIAAATGFPDFEAFVRRWTRRESACARLTGRSWTDDCSRAISGALHGQICDRSNLARALRLPSGRGAATRFRIRW